MIFQNFNWFFIRYIAIFFLFSIIIDLEILFLLINFLFLHILNGFYSIFFDYIHKKKLSFFLLTLLKILLIENLIKVSKFFF